MRCSISPPGPAPHLLLLLVVALPLHGQLLTAPAQLLRQGTGGLQDTALAEESFGTAVVFGDFDCDGYEDLAIGVPGQAAPVAVGAPIPGAGAVHIVYGSASGLSTRDVVLYEDDLDHANAASENGDRFATVLAAGNFDDDTSGGVPCDDLAVGSPFEHIGIVEDAGSVSVLFGDPTQALGHRVQVWTQASAGVLGDVEENDVFGQTLAAGDFDGDGYDDLAVGAPGEPLDDGPEEGAVFVLRGGPAGLAAPHLGNSDWLQLIHQDLAGLEDDGSPGERFGAALAACDIDDDERDDLAIGVPGQTAIVFGIPNANAGGLHVLFGSADGLDLDGDAFELGTQVSARMGFAVAGGDFDIFLPAGPGCELAVGHPFQDVPGAGPLIVDAGQVTLHKPQRGGNPFGSSFALFTETSFPGEVPEIGDLFGSVLAGGDFDGDGYDEVVIGAPGEESAAGALFWFPALDPAKEAYRLADFDHGGQTPSAATLGRVLAVGDVEGNGRPELAAGVPNFGFFGAGIAMRGETPALGAVLLVNAAGLFRDGFEGGDTGAWTSSTP